MSKKSNTDLAGIRPASTEMDLSTPEGRAKVKHVVIMVHGIRDFGSWQNVLENELPISGIATVGIKYGYFDVFRFLFPLGWFRRAAIARVAQRVRDAQTLYPNAQFSYLAHSFGTYVVANMLLGDPSFKAHRIIFCGSVLSPDFPIAQLRGNFSAPLLNEVGTKDIWPFIAESSTWGYGTAGATGFGQSYVRDRFLPLRHGDFLTADFAQKYWLPFLKNGQIEPGVSPSSAGWLKRLASVVRLKYVALAVLALWVWWRPEQDCTEKWLGRDDFETCFNFVKDDLKPLVLEGRRSWLGWGPDVFKAKWTLPTKHRYESRSRLSRDEFVILNRKLVADGYDPLSVRSFVSADGTELVQAIWVCKPIGTGAEFPVEGQCLGK